MEELSTDELIAGLESVEYVEYHSTLLQLFCNKCAEDQTDKILTKNIFSFCLRWLRKSSRNSTGLEESTNMTLIALSNVTVSEEITQDFLAYLNEETQSMDSFCGIISAFLAYNPHTEDEDQFKDLAEMDLYVTDPFQHFSNVLCNITRIDAGRKIILSMSSGFMKALVPQIRSQNLIRRRGSIGCVRNCLFDTEVHWWMLHELNALTTILMPLVVSTPFTEREKQGMDPLLWMRAENPETVHEADKGIIRMLLDCIVLLCQKRGIREYMRRKKVYYICRNLDYKLEDDAINEVVYEIVNFLEREDDPSEPIESYPGLDLSKGKIDSVPATAAVASTAVAGGADIADGTAGAATKAPSEGQQSGTGQAGLMPPAPPVNRMSNQTSATVESELVVDNSVEADSLEGVD